MDEIDHMLLGAWRGMNKRLRMDRVLAARREARAFRVGLLRRPPRACCLALRASDTRLVEDWNVLVDPVGGVECFDVHRLTLRGDVIRDLVKPVFISHRDAMPASKACHLFGRSKESIARWVKRGVFEVEHVPAMSQGMRGRPVPVVWTKCPMDPNAAEGESPDPVWGSAWQWLWKYVPEDDVQTLYRTPRFHSWRGQHVFRGWDWICPGRMVEASDSHDADIRETRGVDEKVASGFVASEPRRAVAGDAGDAGDAGEECDVSGAAAYPRRHVAARGDDVSRDRDAMRNAESSFDREASRERRIPLVREWEMPSLEVLSRVHDVDTGRGVVRYAGCGRRVRHVYSPVRAFSLLDYLGVQSDGPPNELVDGADMMNGVDVVHGADELDGRDWADGADDDDSAGECDDGIPPSIALPGMRDQAERTSQSFACRDCWQPVFTDGVNPNETWNLFVTHMSGGLLTGFDVPRPRGVAERGRRHVFRGGGKSSGTS